MDSSQTSGTWRPSLLHHHHHNPSFLCPQPFPHHHHHHHHHYHLHFSPHCPLHSHLLQRNPHPYACPNSLPLNSQVVLEREETHPSHDVLMTQEKMEGVVEEDEEEPVFVLTDEWREFFAKSEAKRRLAKKQARKEGKA